MTEPTTRAAAGWTYAIDRRELGPFTLDEMRRMARDGRLQPEDRVRPPGDSGWTTASEVAELSRPASVLGRFSFLPAWLDEWLGSLPVDVQWALVGSGGVVLLVACLAASARIGSVVARDTHLGWLPSLLVGALLPAFVLFLAVGMYLGFRFERAAKAASRQADATRGIVESARTRLSEGRFEDAAHDARTAVANALAAEDWILASDGAQILGIVEQLAARHELALAAFRDALRYIEHHARFIQTVQEDVLKQRLKRTDIVTVYGDPRRHHGRLADLAAAAIDEGTEAHARPALAAMRAYRDRLAGKPVFRIDLDQPGPFVLDADYLPDAVLALGQHGLRLLRAGRLDEAEAVLFRALEIRDALFPTEPLGLDQLAPPLTQLLLSKGRTDEARRLMARSTAGPGGHASA